MSLAHWREYKNGSNGARSSTDSPGARADPRRAGLQETGVRLNGKRADIVRAAVRGKKKFSARDNDAVDGVSPAAGSAATCGERRPGDLGQNTVPIGREAGNGIGPIGIVIGIDDSGLCFKTSR